MARSDLAPLSASIRSEMLEYQLRTTHAGMAHFANTGPLGATCGECVFRGYHNQIRNNAGRLRQGVHRRGCEKFYQLTGKHGDIVPASAAACKYFERRAP
jgi:hypothetical protein